MYPAWILGPFGSKPTHCCAIPPFDPTPRPQPVCAISPPEAKFPLGAASDAHPPGSLAVIAIGAVAGAAIDALPAVTPCNARKLDGAKLGGGHGAGSKL